MFAVCFTSDQSSGFIFTGDKLGERSLVGDVGMATSFSKKYGNKDELSTSCNPNIYHQDEQHTSSSGRAKY